MPDSFAGLRSPRIEDDLQNPCKKDTSEPLFGTHIKEAYQAFKYLFGKRSFIIPSYALALHFAQRKGKGHEDC